MQDVDAWSRIIRACIPLQFSFLDVEADASDDDFEMPEDRHDAGETPPVPVGSSSSSLGS